MSYQMHKAAAYWLLESYERAWSWRLGAFERIEESFKEHLGVHFIERNRLISKLVSIVLSCPGPQTSKELQSYVF